MRILNRCGAKSTPWLVNPGGTAPTLEKLHWTCEPPPPNHPLPGGGHPPLQQMFGGYRLWQLIIWKLELILIAIDKLNVNSCVVDACHCWKSHKDRLLFWEIILKLELQSSHKICSLEILNESYLFVCKIDFVPRKEFDKLWKWRYRKL